MIQWKIERFDKPYSHRVSGTFSGLTFYERVRHESQIRLAKEIIKACFKNSLYGRLLRPQEV